MTAEVCRFCGRSDVIAEELYTRVQFPDGIALVCDICDEKADEGPSSDEKLDLYVSTWGAP
jgi:hypothetical protein